MLEITLTWVSGYRRSQKGRDNAPFIRSITHAPDQTYIRRQHLHCLFDLAISPPFWIIAWFENDFHGLSRAEGPSQLTWRSAIRKWEFSNWQVPSSLSLGRKVRTTRSLLRNPRQRSYVQQAVMWSLGGRFSKLRQTIALAQALILLLVEIA